MKPSPYVTSEQDRLRREVNIARATVKVHDLHQAFLAEVETLKALLAGNFREMNRIKNLPEGKQGPRGPIGPRGLPGKDGKNGADGKDAVIDFESIANFVMGRIKLPKDGKDAEVNIDELVDKAVEKILSEKKLKKEHIFGLETELRSIGSLAGKRYGKDTWARGGGMTMSAGQNITLTPQADGTVKIDASGGGSGTNVTTQYSLTAVQAGADVTIDLTQLTNWATFAGLIQLQRNNVPQTETLNFTLVGSTITVFNADASEIYNIVYGYT